MRYCYQLLYVLVSDLFTLALHIASGMKAPASGASLATAAPAAEETPKAAVPSEAQSCALPMSLKRDLFFLERPVVSFEFQAFGVDIE